MEFELHAPYQPTGDQPEAIRQLVKGIKIAYRNQLQLGATVRRLVHTPKRRVPSAVGSQR